MAKYNELIEANAELIQHIKTLRIKQDEISVRLEEAYEDDTGSLGASLEVVVIEDEMANNQFALRRAHERLMEIVEEAYWDVPFAKSRNQGIAKFWELSGLR